MLDIGNQHISAGPQHPSHLGQRQRSFGWDVQVLNHPMRQYYVEISIGERQFTGVPGLDFDSLRDSFDPCVG